MPRTAGGGSTMICASLISARRFWRFGEDARQRVAGLHALLERLRARRRSRRRWWSWSASRRRSRRTRRCARRRACPGAICAGALHDGVGAFERGAIGQLNHGDDVALVRLRDEPRRHDAEHRAGEHQQPDVAHAARSTASANRPAHAAGVGVRRERERAVEQAEEPAEHEVPQPREPVLLRAVRAQHQRAQRGAERERVERGDDASRRRS